MKNSELQDVNPLQNFNLENTEVYERNNMSDSVSISSKRHSKNLSNEDKDVVSKEIEHSINEIR